MTVPLFEVYFIKAGFDAAAAASGIFFLLLCINKSIYNSKNDVHHLFVTGYK